jgi:hypothetical protein
MGHLFIKVPIWTLNLSHILPLSFNQFREPGPLKNLAERDEKQKVVWWDDTTTSLGINKRSSDGWVSVEMRIGRWA